MGSARKRRRLIGFRRQLDRDEELGRFGLLVGAVIVVEILVLFIVWSHTGVMRPLG